jgi:protein-S-isoprenylcysteine O-methyltransferase Ste14
VVSLALWVAAAVAGAVLELAYANRRQYDPTDSARAIDRAMRLGFALSLGAPLLATALPGERPPVLIVALGAVLAAGGLAFRGWAMRTLGPRYTLTPQAQRADHYLCTAGPYRLVRHPGYLGLLLQFIGMGVMLAPLVAVVASIPVVVITALRVVGEERLLVAEFAADYESYRARVRWRVLPWTF